MGNALLWIVVLSALALTWTPVVAELREEFRILHPVSRRDVRNARTVAETIRSRVGDRSPEFVSRAHGDSSGRHRADNATGRDMPPVGTWRVAVPTGGPHTNHGRPVCG